jgi:hypothetical protein
MCGWVDSPNLDAAFPAIYECTKGIPRRINALCDRLLLSGFLSNTKTFAESDVLEVFHEMEGETVTSSQQVMPSGGGSKSFETPLPLLSGGIHQETLQVAQEDLLLRFGQIEERLQRVEGALDGLLANNSKTLSLLTRIAAAIEDNTRPSKPPRQKK